jgi:hypothetical protein
VENLISGEENISQKMIQIRSSIQKKTKIEKIRLKYRLSSYS